MAEDFNAPVAEGAPDAVAIGAALGRSSAAVDTELIAYLRDQRHHIHEQLNQIHLDVWEKKLGVLLRLATLCVGLALAGALALMVWDAAHSKGLIIEPFSVPPDLAQRGLTGEVVAGLMIDKLTAMTESESSRAVQSYANNWGSDIKVEIPETGISIGELRNFLREWLGRDIHSSGEIYRNAEGVVVTVRTNGEKGASFAGKDTDLDALMQKATEHVYEVTQPYRYANYLDRNYDPTGAAQRVAKATAVYRRLIAGDDVKEQAWAWNGLATLQFNFFADNRKSSWYYRKALATNPDFTLVYYALAARNGPLGQEEDDFRNTTEFVRRAGLGAPELNPRYLSSALAHAHGLVLFDVGDFAAAIPIEKAAAERADSFSVLGRGNFISVVLNSMARAHDPAAVRTYLKTLGWTEIPRGQYVVSRFWYAMDSGEWRGVLAAEAGLQKLAASNRLSKAKRITNGDINPDLWPLVAYAHARTGDVAGADKLMAATTQDNATAVRMRAMIAELKGDHARADWWFARSEAQTPSLPLTDLWWGQALLRRGQPDAAIEKFRLANQKGPHFADPLEGWGEALMAKNQSDRAVIKFAQAEQYAPNWGRLHLKWGEALVYAGRDDEAQKQFAEATVLDLTSGEKSELARMNHG